MINQVGSSNVYKNVYAPLKDDGASFAITEPFTQAQKEEEKQEKEAKVDNLGLKIAAVASIFGFGVFGLNKLLSRRSSFKTFKFLDTWEARAEKYGFFKVWDPVRKLLNKTQVIFNIATIKDSLFKRATPKKVDKVITDAFEKVSIGTSRRAYNKTHAAFESMYAKFDEFNSNLTAEQANEINKHIKNIRAKYAQGFSETARNQRLGQTKKDLSGLFEKLWKQIKHPEFYKKALKGSFVAEEEAHQAKIALRSNISKLKEEITNCSKDKHHTTRKLLDGIGMSISTEDKTARDLMKKLWGHLDEYKNKVDGLAYDTINPFPAQNVKKDLIELKDHIAKPNKYYNNDTKEAITEAIKELTDSLHSDKKGEIQEIMDIYKNNLSETDYKKLRKSVNKSLKMFNNAIDLESDKLFDKIRDLSLGSASHDVLAFGLSLAGIGWGISKVDNKDERISVTLKYGIPALFGVAMAIGCTVGLIASGPSLLIGLASTIPVNMIGKAIDNIRKKKEEDPQAKILPKLKFESPLQMIRDIENIHYESV